MESKISICPVPSQSNEVFLLVMRIACQNSCYVHPKHEIGTLCFKSFTWWIEREAWSISHLSLTYFFFFMWWTEMYWIKIEIHFVLCSFAFFQETMLTGLHHKTRYSVEVVAYTLKGDGVHSRVQYVQTMGEGRCHRRFVTWAACRCEQCLYKWGVWWCQRILVLMGL